jgi:hypothetical protein
LLEEHLSAAGAEVVVTEFVSLDGVTEDPGGSGSFSHGGWTFEIDRGTTRVF